MESFKIQFALIISLAFVTAIVLSSPIALPDDEFDDLEFTEVETDPNAPHEELVITHSYHRDEVTGVLNFKTKCRLYQEGDVSPQKVSQMTAIHCKKSKAECDKLIKCLVNATNKNCINKEDKELTILKDVAQRCGVKNGVAASDEYDNDAVDCLNIEFARDEQAENEIVACSTDGGLRSVKAFPRSCIKEGRLSCHYSSEPFPTPAPFPSS